MYPRWVVYNLQIGLYLGSGNGRPAWVHAMSPEIRIFATSTEASAAIPAIPRRLLPRRPFARVMQAHELMTAKGGA